jgi:hypothetical protein
MVCIKRGNIAMRGALGRILFRCCRFARERWTGLSLGLPLRVADYLVFIPVVTIVTLV